MAPVRVNLYGLFPVTKRGYVLLLAVGLFLVLAVFVVKESVPLPPRPTPPEAAAPVVVFWLWILDHFHWIVLAAVFLELFEAVLVFRRFAREEARQRARPVV